MMHDKLSVISYTLATVAGVCFVRGFESTRRGYGVVGLFIRE